MSSFVQDVPGFAGTQNTSSVIIAPSRSKAKPEPEGFFGEEGERMVTARDNAEQNFEYPRPDEAAIMAKDPAFSQYVKSVRDIVSDLKTGEDFCMHHKIE